MPNHPHDTDSFAHARLRAAAVALAAALAGCAVVITAPPTGSTGYTPTVPVEVMLPLPYVTGSFRAWVGERDVTPSFSVDAATRRASGALPVTPGAVHLTVLACWWIPYNGPAPTIPIATSGCPTAAVDIAVQQAALQLTAAAMPVAHGASAAMGVSAVPPPMSALTVQLSGTGTTASVPATVTIPAAASAPTRFDLQATAAGNATLRAQATGWADATVPISVAPRLTRLVPADGLPGTSITLVGTGFASNSQVKVGTTTFSNLTPSAGGTRLAVTLPATMPVGAANVTVQSASVTSMALPFQVLGNAVVFRGTNDRIETIGFTPGTPFSSSTLALLGSQTTTSVSPGILNVGLARDATRLARTGANDLQLFAIGGTPAAPTLTLLGATGLGGGLSGTGSAAAIGAGALLRATNTGLETIGGTGSPLPKLGSFNGAASTFGTALAVDNVARRAWRSVDLGLETYDLADPAAPARIDNKIVGISTSTTGTALDWLDPGRILVRGTNVGLDLLDTTTTSPTRPGFSITGGASSLGVAVAATGTRVVRATSMGLEVWDVSTPAAPRQCSRNNQGDASATGVGVVVSGTVALRATNGSIEAYDISDTSCPAAPSNTLIPPPVILRTGLGLSATGVALIR